MEVAPAVLIAAFILFFVVTFFRMLKKSSYFAGFYFFLFIYTIFAQIGYVYRPELSILLHCYFGPDIFYKYNAFIFLSFISFFSIFSLMYRPDTAIAHHRLVRIKARAFLAILFYFTLTAQLAGLLWFFIADYDAINYDNMAQAQFPLFSMAYKYLAIRTVVLYALIRLRGKIPIYTSRALDVAQFIMGALLFGWISLKTGNRTDGLALALGILMLEYKLDTNGRIFNIKRILIAVFAALSVYVLNYIYQFRGGVYSGDFLSRILFQDYYAPSHILIAAMAFHYIHPVFVLRSNFANALVGLGIPYLQQGLGDLISEAFTRSSGYAFYIFSEGYIALGWFGCIYNGIAVYAGLQFWRRITLSSDEHYSAFLYSLVTMQMANIARGQTSYFIKIAYIFFLPGIILFWLATGILPNFLKRAR